jgi:acetyl esterase/lipase
MNSNIPGQFITSARIQSKGISAESLQASHPEISAAARAARSADRVLAPRAVIDSAMLKANLFILTLLASKLTFAASVETTQVKTPRGASVNVAINVPDSSVAGKRPAVIIAPGAGYHMELPIIKELAEKLVAAGVLAFRFDWNYYATDPAKGQSSAGLSKELEDMQSVVNLAKADARVDAGQIIIAGKSMGSVVAFNVFIRDRCLALPSRQQLD